MNNIIQAIERIKYYEGLYEKLEEAINIYDKDPSLYLSIRDSINELEDYYSSEVWMEDYDLDSKNFLPNDLKRGVLSEDGLWNLLIEKDKIEKSIKD